MLEGEREKRSKRFDSVVGLSAKYNHRWNPGIIAKSDGNPSYESGVRGAQGRNKWRK